MIAINPDAILDDHQRSVIAKIEPFTYGYTFTLTRGRSFPVDQLRIIGKMAMANGVNFPEYEPGKLYYDSHQDTSIVPGTDYPWQRTHSELLKLGFIVNPPIACMILTHYIRASGEDMFDKLMNASPHITGEEVYDKDGKLSGLVYPIDFSGKPSIDFVATVMRQAKSKGARIRNITIEHANNCVHCDLEG